MGVDNEYKNSEVVGNEILHGKGKSIIGMIDRKVNIWSVLFNRYLLQLDFFFFFF